MACSLWSHFTADLCASYQQSIMRVSEACQTKSLSHLGMGREGGDCHPHPCDQAVIKAIMRVGVRQMNE